MIVKLHNPDLTRWVFVVPPLSRAGNAEGNSNLPVSHKNVFIHFRLVRVCTSAEIREAKAGKIFKNDKDMP
jgi:hypothetical protein